MITSMVGLSKSERRAVGQQIAAFRRAKGLSQERLGEIVGVSGAAISTLETGKWATSDDMLAAITAALNGKTAKTVPPAAASPMPSGQDGAPTIGMAIDDSLAALLALPAEDRAIAIAAILRKLGAPKAFFQSLDIEPLPAIDVMRVLGEASIKSLPAAPPARRASPGEGRNSPSRRAAMSRLAAAMESKRTPEDKQGILPRARIAQRIGITKGSLGAAMDGRSSTKRIDELAMMIAAIG